MNQSHLLQSSVRPKIFEEWPRKTERESYDYEQRDNKRSKPRSSLRAEQAIQKSLFFSQNIRTFLELFKEYSEKCFDYQEKFRNIENQLQDLSQQKDHQNKAQYNGSLYKSRLRQYFLTIRKGAVVLRQVRTFVLSNLQNYDPQTTKMKFSRSYTQVDALIAQQMKDLNQKRRRVQQTLVGYEYDVPESVILGEQKNFQNCLIQLTRSMEPDQLTQFHYLMLYKLHELDQLVKKYENLMIVSNQNYSRFQALHDSLNLMHTQTQEMTNDRKHLKGKFNNLSIDNADSLIPKTIVSTPILDKNMRIYQSNLDLLARYNAQTNLKVYAHRRKQYNIQFNKFKQTFDHWKTQQKSAQYLYHRHQILTSFKKKIEVGNDKVSMQWQRKKLQQAYLQCLSYKLSSKNKTSDIQYYKYNLIEDFQKLFKRYNIIMPKRELLPQLKQQQMKYMKNQGKLQQFVDFFVRIKYQKYHQKINYLLQKKGQINAMDYQIGYELKNNDREQQKYRIGVKYAKSITDYLSEHHSFERYIDEVQRYSRIRWQALPIGLEAVVFNFTKDLYTKNEAFQYLSKVYEKQLVSYTNQMLDQISRVRQWDQYVETSQIPYSANLSKNTDRRAYYIKYVRKISDYSPMIRDQLVDQFWRRNQQAVRRAYSEPIKQIRTLGQVDKKTFFSFKILCYLSAQDRKLKVPNIKQLIYHYLGYVDRYDASRWDQKHFFAEIIKQRIIIDNLKILSKYMDTKSEIKSIQKINRGCMLLYEINDHLSLAKNDDLEEHIAHSLVIQKTLNEEQQRNQKINDMKLAQKTDKVCKNMKRSPLIIGNKKRIPEYQCLLNSQSKLQNILNINNKRDQIQFLSEVYTSCQFLMRTNYLLKNGAEFQPSDILAVRDHNKMMIYVEQLADKIRKQIDEDFMEDVVKLEGIYRGQFQSSSEIFQGKKQTTRKTGQLINKVRRLATIKK